MDATGAGRDATLADCKMALDSLLDRDVGRRLQWIQSAGYEGSRDAGGQLSAAQQMSHFPDLVSRHMYCGPPAGGESAKEEGRSVSAAVGVRALEKEKKLKQQTLWEVALSRLWNEVRNRTASLVAAKSGVDLDDELQDEEDEQLMHISHSHSHHQLYSASASAAAAVAGTVSQAEGGKRLHQRSRGVGIGAALGYSDESNFPVPQSTRGVSAGIVDPPEFIVKYFAARVHEVARAGPGRKSLKSSMLSKTVAEEFGLEVDEYGVPLVPEITLQGIRDRINAPMPDQHHLPPGEQRYWLDIDDVVNLMWYLFEQPRMLVSVTSESIANEMAATHADSKDAAAAAAAALAAGKGSKSGGKTADEIRPDIAAARTLNEAAKELAAEFRARLFFITKRTPMRRVFQRRLKEADYCGVCAQEGELLLCDGDCYEAFHLDCVGLTEMPPSTRRWFCDSCSERRRALELQFFTQYSDPSTLADQLPRFFAQPPPPDPASQPWLARDIKTQVQWRNRQVYNLNFQIERDAMRLTREEVLTDSSAPDRLAQKSVRTRSAADQDAIGSVDASAVGLKSEADKKPEKEPLVVLTPGARSGFEHLELAPGALSQKKQRIDRRHKEEILRKPIVPRKVSASAMHYDPIWCCWRPNDPVVFAKLLGTKSASDLISQQMTAETSIQEEGRNKRKPGCLVCTGCSQVAEKGDVIICDVCVREWHPRCFQPPRELEQLINVEEVRCPKCDNDEDSDEEEEDEEDYDEEDEGEGFEEDDDDEDEDMRNDDDSAEGREGGEDDEEEEEEEEHEGQRGDQAANDDATPEQSDAAMGDQE